MQVDVACLNPEPLSCPPSHVPPTPSPPPPQAVDADDDAALAALQNRHDRAAGSKPKGRHIRGSKTSKREARTTAEIMAAVEGHRRAAEQAEEGEEALGGAGGSGAGAVKVCVGVCWCHVRVCAGMCVCWPVCGPVCWFV